MSSDTLAWYAAPTVQAALAASGPHDGSREWTLSFCERLLAEVDKQQERAQLAPKELVEALATWQLLLRRTYSARGDNRTTDPLLGLRTDIPRRLLSCEINGHRMSFEDCAWLLEVTPDALERIMWTRRDDLHEAARRYFAGEPLKDILPQRGYGGNAQRIRTYLRFRHGVAPGVGGNTCVLSHEAVQTAIRWIEEDGLTRKAARARLIELGEIPANYHIANFNKRIRQAMASAAVAA